MRLIRSIKLNIYTTKDGNSPFIDWLESLDNTIRYRIKERLDRVVLGNLGDSKSVGSGVFELRMFFGSGYHIKKKIK